MSVIRRPTAVVVGATGGIGTAVARALARTHELWLVGRESGRLAGLAARLETARTWRVDLAEPAEDLAPPPGLAVVDLLVLAAGFWVFGSIADTSDMEWQDVFAVNLFGQIAVTRALLPALRAAQGRVVILSSTALMGPPSNRAAYTASKAALKVFGEALHEEERANGVSVTQVYPGRVATPMQERVVQSEGGEYRPGHYLQPEVVARSIGQLVALGPEAHVAEIVIRPPFPVAH